MKRINPTYFQPHIYEGDDFSFDGSVEIWVKCHEPTNRIVLHISQLTLDEPTILIRENGPDGSLLVVDNWEIDEARQFLMFTLGSTLEPGGIYYLAMRFQGTHLHGDFYGFYRSTYIDEGVEK